MRKGWLRSIVAIAVIGAGSLGLFASPVTAQCATSTFLEVGVSGVALFYYDDRSGTPPVPGVIVGPDGTWVYDETNGAAGMQRGGKQWVLDAAGAGDLDAEICNDGGPSPDRLWF